MDAKSDRTPKSLFVASRRTYVARSSLRPAVIEPTDQLNALALAAEQHAREQYDCGIPFSDPTAPARVDRILDHEREAGNPEWIEPLTLCFGAWWGEYIRQHWGGRWIGLREPTPPRIMLDGAAYSPLDAIRRRLTDPSMPNLQTLSLELERLTRDSDTDVLAVNRLAWDDKVNDPRFTDINGLPNDREEALAAVDPWLRDEGPLDSCNLLCLAAGGGTHGPLHAMAGASVTVVDFSTRQLERDKKVADELGLSLKLIPAAMHDLTALADETFDAIIHPVSLCYVRDIEPVYTEIARVLKPSGIYISQQKQPASLQASSLRPDVGYVLDHPGDDGYRLSASTEETGFRETGTIEFVHSLETLLGSLCCNGLVIEDIQEPPRGDAWAPAGSPEHRARYLPPYLKIKARRSISLPF